MSKIKIKPKTVILFIIVWFIVCIPAFLYMFFVKKMTYNNGRYYQEMIEMSIQYLQDDLGYSCNPPLECYDLTTDGVDNDLIKKNFLNKNEEYVYPYQYTAVYLEGNGNKWVVYIQKNENGEFQVVGYELIE